MRTLLACLLSSALASAQWPSDPAQNLGICVQFGDQAVPKIAAGGDGSTWVAWFDAASGFYAVNTQKLDAQGNRQFPNSGWGVSNFPQNSSLVDWSIVADGEGGLVLAFTDIRLGGDLDVYAYRLDAQGNFLWGTTGVALSNNSDFEANPKLARLSDGDFAVSWSRSPASGPGSVHVQRLDRNGVPQYPGQGLEIVGAGNEKPAFSAVAASDAGSVIVAYVRDTATFASPRHLRAQKFDVAGNALWNAGAPLVVYDAASMPIAYQPQVIAADGGGAIFAWHSSIGSFFDSYIQRVDAAGSELYPLNGLLVSTEASRSKLEPQIAVAGSGGDCWVAFNKRNSAQSQWASCLQRISIGGTRLYGDSGIELLPFNSIPKQSERISTVGNDVVVLSLEQSNAPLQGLRLFAWRVDASGAFIWQPVVRELSSVLSTKDKLVMAADSSQVVRVAWDDGRNDSGDIYGQNIDLDGTLGPIEVLPYCFQDSLFNACPCNNFGAAGRGCANSVNNAGGWLRASGSPAGPSLELLAEGLPATALAIFLQGSSVNPAGLVFGDGVRCTAGVLKRLYVKNAVNGSAQAPQLPNDASIPSVSAQLGDVIAPGATRSYQVYYRDGDAAFCAAPLGSTFNITNGLLVIWP